METGLRPLPKTVSNKPRVLLITRYNYPFSYQKLMLRSILFNHTAVFLTIATFK